MLAHVLGKLNRFSEAEPLYRQTIAALSLLDGGKGPHAMSATNNLALMLQEAGRYAEAEPLQRKMLALNKRLRGEADYLTMQMASGLGETLGLVGKYAEAEAVLRQTLSVMKRALGPQHGLTLTTTADLERVLQDCRAHAADAETRRTQIPRPTSNDEAAAGTTSLLAAPDALPRVRAVTQPRRRSMSGSTDGTAGSEVKVGRLATGAHQRKVGKATMREEPAASPVPHLHASEEGRGDVTSSSVTAKAGGRAATTPWIAAGVIISLFCCLIFSIALGVATG